MDATEHLQQFSLYKKTHTNTHTEEKKKNRLFIGRGIKEKKKKNSLGSCLANDRSREVKKKQSK